MERPHWDDDLLYSVKRCMNAPAPLTDDDRAYNVIAAVEDWQKNHALMSPVGLLWEQQSAIQRVRELHQIDPAAMGVIFGHSKCLECRHIYPCPTIDALDGA